MSDADSTALKDTFFTRAFAEGLATAITSHYPPFDRETFLVHIFDADWDSRSLLERMRHIAAALRPLLPDDYRAALDIVRQTARALDGYSFDRMVFSEFVALYGLDDWEVSLPALEEFTQRMSAEFAVRPFLVRDQPRMIAQMQQWAQHPNDQVRRLASEGCRPRLPWGIRLPALIKDPSPILPILDMLKLDESETVRRSVANNLNDIAKDNPDVVIAVLRGWQSIDSSDSPEITWMTNHALRTLIKKGHPGALDLLGYHNDPVVAVRNLAIDPDPVALENSVTISFEVESQGDTDQDLIIDYVMHFMKANGQLSPKVFKLRKYTLAPGETVPMRKQHSFKTVSTRKHYPGAHAVEIQVNGMILARVEFEVVE
ncbi:MAG: DNA alkylation repair protein [Anaerolineae bacterium]|nr:DNA alkylation repair protein [Anaerolineae bacterium]